MLSGELEKVDQEELTRASWLDGIRAVTFDIGGTLIEPWPSVGHVYATVAARHGIQIKPEVLDRQFAEAWKSKKQFGHSMADWSSVVDATFAGLVPVPPSQTFFRELYEYFASPETWRIFEDALPCLDELKQRGIRLGAISNWDERLRGLLTGLKLASYFETIVVSVEIGCGKPCREMFETAATQMALSPETILHVGDRRVADMEGARAVGMKSVLIRRGVKPVEGMQISSLRELFD